MERGCFRCFARKWFAPASSGTTRAQPLLSQFRLKLPPMIWLLVVPLIIFWAFLQKQIVDSTGAAPRSRRSFRGQRRKAAKMGMDAQGVPYNLRSIPMENFKIPGSGSV